ETAPALYAGGSNAVGFHKSTDFGVTWSDQLLPAAFGDYRYQQVYSVDVDPYDTDHILVAFHEAPDVAESTDGGTTWTKFATPPEDGGSSYYPFFINTGDAGTTHETWLTIPQQNGDARALRTTDGGTSWTKLGQFQHHHGSAQIFDAGSGLIYVAAMSPGGVHKSTDYGVTWASIYDGDGGVVTATPNFLYSSVGFGWGKVDAPLDPGLITAPRNTDDTWSHVTPPAGMVDGAKRMAVTYDGAHHIVVAGSWHAGIWRYVEP
ncbi:MAG TPA: sialidase family protein, partial [Polyangiaceae bacterium]|nr:sialidase family protein [Polyangiaceae bacterium]